MRGQVRYPPVALRPVVGADLRNKWMGGRVGGWRMCAATPTPTHKYKPTAVPGLLETLLPQPRLLPLPLSQARLHPPCPPTSYMHLFHTHTLTYTHYVRLYLEVALGVLLQLRLPAGQHRQRAHDERGARPIARRQRGRALDLRCQPGRLGRVAGSLPGRGSAAPGAGVGMKVW